MRKTTLLATLLLIASVGSAQWAPGPTTTGFPLVHNSYFFSAQVGYISGYVSTPGNSGVKKTTNSGNSWVSKVSSAHPLIGFYMYDANVGWVSYTTWEGAPAQLMHTTDGGETWTTLSERVFSHFHFLTPDQGFAIRTTEHDSLYKTMDGGSTWTAHHINLPNATMFMANQVYFLSTSTGYIIGGNNINNPQGEVWRTTDGGSTWEILNLPFTNGVFQEMDFASATHGIICGRDLDSGSAIILRTVDGGQNWQSVPPGVDEMFSTIKMVDQNVVYVGSHDTHIYVSTDGGITWTLDYNGPSSLAIYTMSLAGGSGYAFGTTGIFFRNSSIVSVTEHPTLANVSIGPNPAQQGTIYISIGDGTINGHPLEIQLLDLMGRNIAEEKIALHSNGGVINYQLPTSAASGTYLLKLISDNKEWIGKLIIP